jgi:hypothetical protein
VRYDLHGFAEIYAFTLFFDYALIYATCCDVVGTSGLYVGKTLVVSKVKVCFVSINGYIAFAVFIGIECARVDVDIRVKFLDCDTLTASLKQARQ